MLQFQLPHVNNTKPETHEPEFAAVSSPFCTVVVTATLIWEVSNLREVLVTVKAASCVAVGLWPTKSWLELFFSQVEESYYRALLTTASGHGANYYQFVRNLSAPALRFSLGPLRQPRRPTCAPFVARRVRNRASQSALAAQCGVPASAARAANDMGSAFAHCNARSTLKLSFG